MSNLSEWIKTCDELEARCNELKDENARLRAEVDNLRKNADISPSQSPHEITRLKAEVERLRNAGDAMQKSMLECGPNEMGTAFHYDEWWVSYYGWNAAKDGKPSV